LWQEDAGMVPAARGTELMQRLAAANGATLFDQARVTAIRDLGAAHGFKFAPDRPALTTAQPQPTYLV
jgi:hypothetical protein